MPRRPALVVAPLTLLVLLTATLAGCAEPTRLPPPEPSAAAPLFASDEEALAAATAAYEEYLAVSNAVFREPPRDLKPLSEVVTDRFLEGEIPVAAQFDENGWVVAGGTQLTGTRLQQWFADATGQSTVIFYACVDVTEARILDRNGLDVTPSERPSEVTLEVELVGEGPESLLVDRSELWEQQDTCD